VDCFKMLSAAQTIEAAHNLSVPTEELERLAQNGGHQPINVAHFRFFQGK
jgi:hypothetical protein